MLCPSDKCGSSNVEHLPHYWQSLPGDSPLKGKYAQPPEADGRTRLVLAAVAVLGIVVLATGDIVLGLAMLAIGGAGAIYTTGRIGAAQADRALWQRKQICLACTHLWVP